MIISGWPFWGWPLIFYFITYSLPSLSPFSPQWGGFLLALWLLL